MKICIVTVYNSENCGSVLQAYALGKKLTCMGHSVCYLYREKKGTGASTIKVSLVILKSLIKGNVENARLKWLFHKKCSNDEKEFNTVGLHEIGDADAIILGSDTIWQLNNQYFNSRFSRFWGLDFAGKTVISYAPSINDTRESLFVNNSMVSNALEKMSAISVRDVYSKQILEKCSKKQIQIVCDPTMLLSISDYHEVQRECPLDTDFILIYAFRDFCSPEDINEIKQYAQKRHCKLVSFGVARKWCDISVPFDTFAMPAYYEKASYIITNTFHGNVFSLIYSKVFINFSTSKKVLELLRQFSLEDRSRDKDIPIPVVLDTPVDFESVSEKISELKKQSVCFLETSLIGGE